MQPVRVVRPHLLEGDRVDARPQRRRFLGLRRFACVCGRVKHRDVHGHVDGLDATVRLPLAREAAQNDT